MCKYMQTNLQRIELCLFILQCTHLFIHLSIRSSIYQIPSSYILFIYPSSIHRFIHSPVHQSIHLYSTNPNPTTHHSVWGVFFGSAISLAPQWTIGQPTVQRIISARTEKDAKWYVKYLFVVILLNQLQTPIMLPRFYVLS